MNVKAYWQLILCDWDGLQGTDTKNYIQSAANEWDLM